MKSFLASAEDKSIGFAHYFLGSLLVIIFAFIGQLPLVIAIYYQAFKNGTASKIDADTMFKYLDSNLSLFLLLLSFAAGMLALYLVVKYLHKKAFKDIITSRREIDYSRVFFAFGLWTVFSIVSTVIMYYVSPNDFVVNFELLPFIILCLVAIPLIPVQTTLEELLFRGYLMQGFASLSHNRWFPLVMTSVIFGGLHYFNPEVKQMGGMVMVYYIGTGLFLGIITLMDEGTELALGFHAANNLIASLLVTSDWTVFQTNSVLKDISDPTAGVEIFLPVLVIFPILTFVFAKKYNWQNWKQKLTGSINQIQA